MEMKKGLTRSKRKGGSTRAKFMHSSLGGASWRGVKAKSLLGDGGSAPCLKQVKFRGLWREESRLLDEERRELKDATIVVIG